MGHRSEAKGPWRVFLLGAAKLESHRVDAETESWAGDGPTAQSPEEGLILQARLDPSPFNQS